jgi:hypothetical protein
MKKFTPHNIDLQGDKNKHSKKHEAKKGFLGLSF